MEEGDGDGEATGVSVVMGDCGEGRDEEGEGSNEEEYADGSHDRDEGGGVDGNERSGRDAPTFGTRGPH